MGRERFEDLDNYRAMTPSERFAMALDLSNFAWKMLDVPDRATGDRKWERWNREHDASNPALAAAFARMNREEAGPRSERK